MALYNGISAAILRQATYSTTRFAVYDIGKIIIHKKSKNKHPDLPFYQKIGLAGMSGVIGGIIGNFYISLLFLGYKNYI